MDHHHSFASLQNLKFLVIRYRLQALMAPEFVGASPDEIYELIQQCRDYSKPWFFALLFWLCQGSYQDLRELCGLFSASELCDLSRRIHLPEDVLSTLASHANPSVRAQIADLTQGKEKAPEENCHECTGRGTGQYSI